MCVCVCVCVMMMMVMVGGDLMWIYFPSSVCCKRKHWKGARKSCVVKCLCCEADHPVFVLFILNVFRPDQFLLLQLAPRAFNKSPVNTKTLTPEQSFNRSSGYQKKNRSGFRQTIQLDIHTAPPLLPSLLHYAAVEPGNEHDQRR